MKTAQQHLDVELAIRTFPKSFPSTEARDKSVAEIGGWRAAAAHLKTKGYTIEEISKVLSISNREAAIYAKEIDYLNPALGHLLSIPFGSKVNL